VSAAGNQALQTGIVPDALRLRLPQAGNLGKSPLACYANQPAQPAEQAAQPVVIHWNKIRRGYIGLQRPGHVNAPELDSLSARRNPLGQIEIVFQDATLNPGKRIYLTPPQSWVTEAQAAVQNLSLGDVALEQEIIAAFGPPPRFVMETTLVQVETGGVRFTPM